MPEFAHGSESGHFSPETKTFIANRISEAIRTALLKAARERTPLAWSESATPAFTLDRLNQAKTESDTVIETALWKAQTGRGFTLKCGDFTLQLDNTLTELVAGNFNCFRISKGDLNLHLDITKTDTHINFESQLFFKLIPENTFPTNMESPEPDDWRFKVNQAHQALKTIFQNAFSPETAQIRSESIMSTYQGLQYVDMLSKLRMANLPLIVGEGQHEWTVGSLPLYANKYNPEGLMLYDNVVPANSEALQQRRVPIPLLDRAGQLEGWTFAITLATYKNPDQGYAAQQKITLKSDYDFLDDYEQKFKPNQEKIAQEWRAWQVTQAWVEKFFTAYGHLDLNTRSAFDRLVKTSPTPALREINQALQLQEQSPMFRELSSEITTLPAFKEFAAESDPILFQFLTSYLALKVLTGQLELAAISRRVEENGAFIWFSSLEGCLKYLLMQDGHLKLVAESNSNY
jgi:hypothetical protein